MIRIKGLKELPLKNVEIKDKFWNNRLYTNRKTTLNHQYMQLINTGRIDNFKKAARGVEGNYSGVYFNDSDVYKWLEAASYNLIINYNDKLKTKIEEVVQLIVAAQKEDGYLNTYFILVEPEKRWTNLGMMHELYCAGHLFQAAVAHYKATDSKVLLKAACRFADHIDKEFRLKKRKGIPGHEEIELALVELFRVTGRKRYLELAQFFIDNRGQEDSCFKKELNNLKNIAGIEFQEEVENYGSLDVEKYYKKLFLDKRGNYTGKYAQDHLPVRKQQEVVGHAVRAMYLYSGMTDIAIETGENELIETLMRLWENMTKKRMYITGGIGSSHKNEGFTEDYHLPNKTAYAETCAAVGNIMWNHRMLKLTGDSRFADIVERTLYNGFLAGVSLTGDKFFYVNPLTSDGNHHRKGWFNVSCCPPNIARLLSSLGKYIYLKDENGVFINLYIEGKARLKFAQKQEFVLRQETNYPWDNQIKVKVSLNKPARFKINLRIPGWCQKADIKINGDIVNNNNAIKRNGYICLKRKWSDGDEIELILEMPVELIKSHPAVTNNYGKIAIQRGPVIYCLEEIDNCISPEIIFVSKEFKPEIEYDPDFLNGAIIIKGDAKIPVDTVWQNNLYLREEESQMQNVKFKAIPYHLWDHRHPGAMRVWLNSK